ncbi:MAG: PDZ domain-containing protein, partial [Candidatus Eisenbacteria bacterium]
SSPFSRYCFPMILILLLLFIASAPAFSEEPPVEDRGWLGIYTEPVDSLPVVEERLGGEGALFGATSGLLVTAVFPFSPAEEGGLLVGDVIVSICGEPFACPKESVTAVYRRTLEGKKRGEPCPMRIVRTGVKRDLRFAGGPASRIDSIRFWFEPSRVVDSLEAGDSLVASARVAQEVLDLPIVLGPRPEAKWPAGMWNAEIDAEASIDEGDFAPLVRILVERYGIEEETDDLSWRLRRCHWHPDPERSPLVMAGHREPLSLEGLVEHLEAVVNGGSTRIDLPGLSDLYGARRIRKYVIQAAPLNPLRFLDSGPPNERISPVLDSVEDRIAVVSESLEGGFQGWRPEDRRMLEESLRDLTEVFAEDIYIHFDRDRERYERNRRMIALALSHPPSSTINGAVHANPLVELDWARALADSLRVLYADSLEKEILFEKETEYGRIVIAGTGSNRHTRQNVAFLIDLGGDDLYLGNAGGARGPDLPVAVCIDVSGNDSYEATEPGSQGSGTLGVGMLLDLEGDDMYIGTSWAQGTGYFGVGLLHDVAGDDTYRGRTFCQGVGLFGMGFLIDENGNDRYEGDGHVQGVGMPRGIGALSDRAGNDEYYAKGHYPTGYGTPGIFDAWSQGCGVGFRTLASGGIGILVDGGGADRMEAGNFSQGGGYYYGMGIVRAEGKEDDVYVGSRYNQGFSAHQAVGVFLEEGGNDLYTTRHGVAQGLAWDECVTLFIDEGGNDVYEGGGFFSEGASAHNSFCFFLDRGGRDEYRYPPGPALAGGNDYHGGTSFSLFVDEGGAEDVYASGEVANDTLLHRGEHGFFLDIEGTVEDAARNLDAR